MAKPKVAKGKGAKGKGAAKKQRKKKDPNAPKRGMSAFMIYANEVRAEVKEDHPGIGFGELGKKLGELWRGLSDSEKKPYQNKAAKDKERYMAEKAAYEAKKSEELEIDDDDDDEEEEEDDDDDDDE
eukprot:m.331504 g.331504  ORF g.331504 m.331504 type:complete len:127 (+) comp16746_c0_seq1:159-539(+)